MKTATKILFLSTFFMSLFLQAGGSVGNGGDVMLCKKTDGTVKSIELLDYYESRILRKINVNLGADQLSPQEKVQLVLKRIEKFSPRRYTKYRDWAESFIADTNFVNNANLVDVPDSEIPFFPDGCKLEQIAIQKAPTFPEDKRYLVNSDIWEQLDNNGKAGLILHEIIYREAIELGQSNSKGVRYFNSVISSLLVEQMTTVQFIKLISSAGFNYVETGNLELTEVEFYPDGQISEAKVLSGSLLINGKAIEIEKDISYYPDGSVKSAVLKSNADIAVGGQTLSFSAGRVEFYENGNLKQAYPSCAKDAKKTYTGSNYIINLTTNCVTRSIAKFHSNGKPESFQQMEGVIKSAYGQLKIAQEVRFNSDGQIEFAKTKSGVKNEYRIGNTLYDISDDYNIWFVNFYADGAIDAIKGIDIKSPKTITIQNFALPVDDNLEFHQNGAVQVMRINNQVLRRQDGTLKYYKGIQRVEFDLNGFVIDDEVNLSMDLISLDTFTNDVIL